MIATMATNMPKPDDDCKTTLIVVPAALLQQVRNFQFIGHARLNTILVER